MLTSIYDNTSHIINNSIQQGTTPINSNTLLAQKDENLTNSHRTPNKNLNRNREAPDQTPIITDTSLYTTYNNNRIHPIGVDTVSLEQENRQGRNTDVTCTHMCENKIKSISTHESFNIEEKAINHLQPEDKQAWYESTEEYDEEMEIELSECMEIQRKRFNLPDGTPNVRRCEKYIETLEAIRDGYDKIIDYYRGRTFSDTNSLDFLRDRMGEAVRIIDEVFVEDGKEKEEVCRGLLPDLEETIDRLETMAEIGRGPKEAPSQEISDVTPSMPNVTPIMPNVTQSMPNVTPSMPNVTPSMLNVTPSMPNVTPSMPNVTPSMPNVTPSMPNVTPSMPNVTPNMPNILPSIPWSGYNNFNGPIEEDLQQEIKNPTRTMVLNVVQNAQPIAATANKHVWSKYCHIDDKILTKCTQCEAARDYRYCLDVCNHCKGHARLYNEANNNEIRKIYAQRIKANLLAAMTPTVTPEISPAIIPVVNKSKMFNRQGNFIDKFLAISYTLRETDVAEDNKLYLEQQLIRNFKRMTEREDMPCKAYMCVIEYTKSQVPHIHGIVRLSTELMKNKKISIKNGHFEGKNKIIINGKEEQREEKLKILLKPTNVAGWMAYMEKNYIITGEKVFMGDIGKIIEGWEYINTSPIYPF